MMDVAKRLSFVDYVASISEKRMSLMYFGGNIIMNRLGKIPGSSSIVGWIGLALAVVFFVRCMTWRKTSKWGVFFMGFWVVMLIGNIFSAMGVS
ncbi:TPA: hypothetical protein ACHTCC_003782 [Citrobacter freundii]